LHLVRLVDEIGMPAASLANGIEQLAVPVRTQPERTDRRAIAA
jgi:hypothetical protein